METVNQTRTRIEAIIKEKAPDIDISPGSVFSEIVTGLTAYAQNSLYNTIADIEASKTIKSVLTSATDTFSDVVDRLASNYDTYRNEGKRAAGSIKVIVNKAKTYYIPTGFQFIQPNLEFTYSTITEYTISPTSTPVALQQEGSTYFFIIPVQADNVGRDKQVSFGTKFAIAVASAIPEFVDAMAHTTFTQGEDKESDRELITRFRLGLSTKNLISPAAIETVLKDNYPEFKLASIRGAGDPENIRSTGNPFGILAPGVADVYVRMSDAIPTTTVTLTGTKIVGGDNDGKWTLTIPANAVPGFYRILSIIKSGGSAAGTLSFHSIAYGYDTTLYANKNIVNSTEEARFSKYQTCTVIFNYTSSNASESFDVTVSYQPQIADIQVLFLDNATRIPCADYLVRSVVPCSISVKLQIVKLNPLDTIDTNGIKTDIFNYINGIPIGESISVSKIVDICHNYKIKRVELPIVINGSILAPFTSTDRTLYISGTDILSIPNNPELGVTPYTTSFFINYFDENGNEAIGVDII